MNKIYSISLNHLMAPLTDVTNTFDIPNSYGDLKLRSIRFDLAIWDESLPFIENLPIAQNLTQTYSLSVRQVPGAPNICETFQNIVAPAGSVDTGRGIVIYTPGQSFFDSFYIRNGLRFTFYYSNADNLISYRYLLSLSVETEKV